MQLCASRDRQTCPESKHPQGAPSAPVSTHLKACRNFATGIPGTKRWFNTPAERARLHGEPLGVQSITMTAAEPKLDCASVDSIGCVPPQDRRSTTASIACDHTGPLQQPTSKRSATQTNAPSPPDRSCSSGETAHRTGNRSWTSRRHRHTAASRPQVTGTPRTAGSTSRSRHGAAQPLPRSGRTPPHSPAPPMATAGKTDRSVMRRLPGRSRHRNIKRRCSAMAVVIRAKIGARVGWS